MPNNQDVLQYLMLNLSGIQGTNLQSSWAYRGVAASPSLGDRTRLYLNTTSSQSNISYEITNTELTPVIYLRLDYSNDAGGHDVHSGGDNYFTFNLTINSTHNLNGAYLYLRFARNTLNLNDSIHLYGVSATSGSAQAQDSDGDGFFDRLYWTGSLTAGVNVRIDFSGRVTPGVNFNENFMYVDLDQGTTSQATYSDVTKTFTGISFIDRFSRGPVREGVEMYTMENWLVRGFIKNMATGLDYRLHNWSLYEIGQSSPLIYSNINVYPFGPGKTNYTDWYDTGIPGVQEDAGYYAIYWDWEVGWGSSSYSGISQGEITLPVLREIDEWVDKSVVIDYTTSGGTGLSVQDLARHMGYSGLPVNSVSINSVIPHQSSGRVANQWTPSGVRVYYINASGQTDITSYVSISSQGSATGDGFVNVNIPDVMAAIGRYLGQNEDIRLDYDVTGGSRATTQTYQFCQQSTLTTLSGTPVTKSDCQDVVVPGAGGVPGPSEPSGPGGPSAPVAPALYADIVREVGEGYFVADNLVSVVGSYDIVDTGTKGIKGIGAAIYVPENGRLDLSSLSFRIYSNSLGRWSEWVQGTEYIIADSGIVQVGGTNYREYIISKVSSGIFDEGLSLFNGDKIEIGYMTTVPVGTSFLITRVSGYNYYEDKYIFEDLYIPFRREGALQDLLVDEGDWQLEKLYVGAPAKWVKGIEVYNPNNVSVEQSISFDVFPDSLSVHLIQDSGEGRESLMLKEGGKTYVDVIVRIGPGETRAYALEAVTPPVIETRRSVDVLESSESEIVFMVNITLESFALENYTGTSLLFKSDAGKIEYVSEGRLLLNYTDYDSSTTEVFLGNMRPGWKRELTIVYREVPPILLTAMDAVMYGCSDYAKMTVFVIPSEMETGSYLEVEVMGPDPQRNTMNAQLIEMREIWPWEEIRVPVSVDISGFPDGRYFVSTRFKKDFQTILSDQSDFYVNCPERSIVSVSWTVFLGVALVLTGYLLLRSLRRRKEEGLGPLKKKLRELR